MDAEQAEHKFTHKAAQNTHQDIAPEGCLGAPKASGNLAGKRTHQHAYGQ